jgi:RNA polymerase sigma factor (sigma-70 family)
VPPALLPAACTLVWTRLRFLQRCPQYPAPPSVYNPVKTEAHLPDPLDSARDRQLAEAIAREQPRLRNFIRRRVVDPSDVEDILQDVFYELTLAYQLYKPVEHVGAWLYRVARNRIIDLFRKTKHKPQSLADTLATSADGDALQLEDLLPSPDAGPEALFARTLLLEEFADALDELPRNQRDVFVATELNGRSFKDFAAETGVSVNALLSRKHSAVLHLRRRLQAVYDDFKKG